VFRENAVMKIMLRLAPLIVIALSLLCGPASAADLPVETNPKPVTHGPVTHDPVPTHGNVFVRPDMTCTAWSDGCRTCQQLPDGKASCSNTGIACQPKEISCQQR
jgi:hypothetical protein